MIAISERGIAIREIKVVLTFRRKRNNMIITKTPPSSNTRNTLLTAVFIKSACLNIPEFIITSPGKAGIQVSQCPVHFFG